MDYMLQWYHWYDMSHLCAIRHWAKKFFLIWSLQFWFVVSWLIKLYCHSVITALLMIEHIVYSFVRVSAFSLGDPISVFPLARCAAPLTFTSVCLFFVSTPVSNHLWQREEFILPLVAGMRLPSGGLASLIGWPLPLLPWRWRAQYHQW